MTQSKRTIELFCLGNCQRPAGELIKKEKIHRGLLEWQFGGAVAALSIDAQEFAFDNMARMLAKHVDRDCQIIRFPRDPVPAALMPFLDLDETRPEAMHALMNQARSDANMTNSKCGDCIIVRDNTYIACLWICWRCRHDVISKFIIVLRLALAVL